MKISLACDHGGFEYKEAIANHLKEKGYEVIDCGTNGKDSVDYPVFGEKAARLVSEGKADFGIVVCTSGIGISVAANKVPGVICGVGYDDVVAEKIREHNNANMISFGQAYMTLEDVLKRVDIFLSTPFAGGRHQRRVDQLLSIK
ncbi:MAG: RpiB/LacA/LacB family sugar-phosphate isomerase [Bacilli bacterium]|nr:RpiB/LacA/LacB family sugar-phosphate isomerase [Bacilli bacterium]